MSLNPVIPAQSLPSTRSGAGIHLCYSLTSPSASSSRLDSRLRGNDGLWVFFKQKPSLAQVFTAQAAINVVATNAPGQAI